MGLSKCSGLMYILGQGPYPEIKLHFKTDTKKETKRRPSGRL